MTNQHPITPPPELVQQWHSDALLGEFYSELSSPEPYLAARAAQWGAEAQLEKCHEWLNHRGFNRTFLEEFRAALRPKPLSLKQQALELVDRIEKAESIWAMSELDTIRRALEALPE
jgi:hypothetical protein